MTPCACGDATAHKIARRQTADGIGIAVWSDGAITGYLGGALRGVPVARPRSPDARAAALRAAWMFADEACLYDADEIGALYAACRWASDNERDLAAMRRKLAGPNAPALRPVWEVLEADRDGNPRERVWRVPRIYGQGRIAVWDTIHGDRYHVHQRIAADTYAPTGIKFARLADLAAYLTNTD